MYIKTICLLQHSGRQLGSQWQWLVIFLRLWFVRGLDLYLYVERLLILANEKRWKNCNVKAVLGEWLFSFSWCSVEICDSIGSWCLETCRGRQMWPQRKDWKGFGFGAGLGSGLQLAISKQGLEVLIKKKTPGGGMGCMVHNCSVWGSVWMNFWLMSRVHPIIDICICHCLVFGLFIMCCRLIVTLFFNCTRT